MRNGLCFGLVVMLVLCLCACTPGTPSENTDTQTTTEDILDSTGENVTETTETAHSGLYLPPYSGMDVVRYFNEIVLSTEYAEGSGDATLVQKWKLPIRYRIYGEPTEMDLTVLEELFARLNEIEGFPGIHAAKDDEFHNLTISFMDAEAFSDAFSTFLQGEYAFGANQYWYYTDTNEIHTARIGYRTDVEQTTRVSILLEEIVNVLGVSDTVLREDSIVYQYSNDNMALSDMDWLILKLLYHPQIQGGMNAEDCKAVIQALYY